MSVPDHCLSFYFAIKFGAYYIDFDSSVTLVTRGSYNRSTSNNASSIWNLLLTIHLANRIEV